MPGNKNRATETTLQQTLLKTTNANANSKATASTPPQAEPSSVTCENAKVMRFLETLAVDQKKILDDQTKHFADIQNQLLETKRSTSAFEMKITDLVPRGRETAH